MKIANVHVVLAILFMLVAAPVVGAEQVTQTKQKELRCVVIDSGEHHPLLYYKFFEIMRGEGVRVDYLSLAQWLDKKIDTAFLSAYDQHIFIIDVEALRAPKNSLIKKMLLERIQFSGRQVHACTTLLFSALGSREAEALGYAQPFLDALGLDTNKVDTDSSLLSQKIGAFLATPFEARAAQYETTLCLKRRHTSTLLERLTQLFAKPSGYFSAGLPILNVDPQDVLRSLLPFGLYLYHPHKQHHILLSFSSPAISCGVTESFQWFPLESDLQKRFVLHYAHMWRQLFALLRRPQNYGQQPLENYLATVPRTVQKSLIKEYDERAPRGSKKISWMELVAFDPDATGKPADVLRQQKELVESVVAMKQDYLWISLSPQMYYGVHAKNPAKKRDFQQGYVEFCNRLRQCAREKNVAVPKILVGFEIANNLYEPHLPENPAQDIYGTVYPDVPAPLDDVFWQQEFVDPFKEFYHFCKKQNLALVPAGVVLDLELYCRRLTGTFFSTMVCDAKMMPEFLGQMQAPDHLDDLDAALQWLIDERRIKEFFALHVARAHNLGKRLRREVEQLLGKQALLGVYTQSIFIDWFFTQFMRGLGDARKPLELFTFNTSSARLLQKLSKELGLFVHHHSVLMLSKLSTKESFGIVDTIAKRNQGIWLNRGSRFAEKYDAAAWHVIEQPRLKSKENKASFYTYFSQF